MSKTATIICVRNEDLWQIPVGVTSIDDIEGVCLPEAWAGPRPILEDDPTFRQVIPYVIVRDYDKILSYRRGKTGGESRLHTKVSIGFGGHIDFADAESSADGSIDLNNTLVRAAMRELGEEIGFTPFSGDLQIIGLIKSDISTVDRVHLGVVMKWEAARDMVLDNSPFTYEDTIVDAKFMTVEELRKEDLESWSALALDLL